MKVTGLDGKEHSWNLEQNKQGARSSLHIKARALLKSIYPFDRILEELTLPGSKTRVRKSLLTADFFIPNRNLMVEVNGEQHFKQNAFFHKNAHAFYKGLARDRDKAEWCEVNEIRLVNLDFDNEEEWEKLIKGEL